MGTLITFETANDYQAAGFTARTLTGDEQALVQPPLHPVPDLVPPRPAPAPAHWATPHPSRSRTHQPCHLSPSAPTTTQQQ